MDSARLLVTVISVRALPLQYQGMCLLWRLIRHNVCQRPIYNSTFILRSLSEDIEATGTGGVGGSGLLVWDDAPDHS